MANKKITLGQDSTSDIQVSVGSTNTINAPRIFTVGESNNITTGTPLRVTLVPSGTQTQWASIQSLGLSGGSSVYAVNGGSGAGTILFRVDDTSAPTTQSVAVGQTTITIPSTAKYIGVGPYISIVKQYTTKAKNSLVVGTGLTVGSDNSITCGRYNNNHPEHLFEVGNGTSATDKNTIFGISEVAVRTNGNMILNGHVRTERPLEEDVSIGEAHSPFEAGYMRVVNIGSNDSTVAGAIKGYFSDNASHTLLMKNNDDVSVGWVGSTSATTSLKLNGSTVSAVRRVSPSSATTGTFKLWDQGNVIVGSTTVSSVSGTATKPTTVSIPGGYASSTANIFPMVSLGTNANVRISAAVTSTTVVTIYVTPIANISSATNIKVNYAIFIKE